MVVTGDFMQIIYTYGSWGSMKERCTKLNSPSYKDYGGRGIKVCERWLNSPISFVKDMGVKPVGTSLERIDVNGDYEPSNCCWATKKTQAQNRRTSIALTHNGETKNCAEWAREMGLGVSTVISRYRAGMTMEEVLNPLVRGTSKERARNRRNQVHLTYNGKSQCMSAWAEETGLSIGTLWERKSLGWSDEKILTTPVHHVEGLPKKYPYPCGDGFELLSLSEVARRTDQSLQSVRRKILDGEPSDVVLSNKKRKPKRCK